MNSTHLVGRVGNDPELRHSGNQQPVTNLTLATDERWTDRDGKRQQRTEWHRLVFWGEQAKLVDQYVRRGDQLAVEGRLQTRAYVDKQQVRRHVTEVVVLRLHLLDQVDGTPEDEETDGNVADPDDREIPF